MLHLVDFLTSFIQPLGGQLFLNRLCTGSLVFLFKIGWFLAQETNLSAVGEKYKDLVGSECNENRLPTRTQKTAAGE